MATLFTIGAARREEMERMQKLVAADEGLQRRLQEMRRKAWLESKYPSA